MVVEGEATDVLAGFPGRRDLLPDLVVAARLAAGEVHPGHDTVRCQLTERLPQVLAPRARRTYRLAAAQQRIGLALGGAAGERLADEIALPAGTDTLLAEVRQAPIPAAL